MDTQGQKTTQTLDQLNHFLRGELSAVETYKIAVAKLTNYAQLQKLEQCLLSHEERVSMLRRKIQQLGGDPEQTSGLWGAFAKLVEGGAKLFGESPAIHALEQGEDHGLSDYRDLKEADATVRQVVSAQLLPAQMETHAAMSRLKKELN